MDWTSFTGVFKTVWDWITRADIYAKIEQCDQDRSKLRDEVVSMKAAQIAAQADLETCRELLMIGTLTADRTGRICEASPETCKMTGFSEIQMLSMNVNDLLPINFRARHAALFRELVEGKRTVRSTLVEGEIRRADYTSALVLVKIAEIPHGSGNRFRVDLIRRH